MAITLRQESDPQATTKGSALTFSELDNNFIHVLNNGIIVVGDDSTGTELTLGNTLKIVGGTGITTAMSGDTLTITGIPQAQGITVVGDDSTGTQISDGETVKIAGGTNITTSMSGDTLTISGPTLTSYLENVADDTTPQLGADLDVNSQSIVSTANGNITIAPNGTGQIVIGNTTDTATVSTQNEQSILLRTSSTNSSYIEIDSNTDGNDITLFAQDESAAGQVLIGNDAGPAYLSSVGTATLTLHTNKGTSSASAEISTNDITLKPTTSGHVVIGNGSTAGTITSNGSHSLIFSANDDNIDSAFIEIEDGNTGSVVIQPGTTEDSAGGNRLRITATGGDNGDFTVQSGGSGGMLFQNNENEQAYPTGAFKMKNSVAGAQINMGQFLTSDIQYWSLYFDPNEDKYTKRVGSFNGDQNVFFGYNWTDNYTILQGNGGDKFEIDTFNDAAEGYQNKGPIELAGGYVKIASQLPYINIQGITDSTQPPRPESSANIFAADDGGTVEMYVQDEASNITKISPHNDQGEWEYFSRNSITGKTVRVNMEKMIRKLEQITGESFFEEYTPGN